MLEDEREVFLEKILRTESVRQDAPEAEESVGIGVGIRGGVRIGDYESDLRRVADLLEELTAMSARRGGDGEVSEMSLAVEGEIGYEELLGVDRVVEREAWELDVDS